MPSFADTETTLAELKERIAKTVAFIQTIPDTAFADAESRTIMVKAGPHEMSFAAPQYYGSYAIPNFYFHLTTAYAILRCNGVEVGKGDFADYVIRELARKEGCSEVVTFDKVLLKEAGFAAT